MTAPTDTDQHPDRALHGAGAAYHGCSAHRDGHHAESCPGSRGQDDDLDEQTP